ncbi:MAG: ATP-binding protein, partial [Polyangia bacterium]
MDFVGRHEEVERLNSLCRRRQGGLAVLTGRRRVGKTRLLVEWNRRHDGLYTVADQSAPEIQRRYFCEALAGRFPVFQEATFRDWRAILKALARQAEAGSWKGPLILDEFPFLVASSPELPSVVQHWIDQDAAAAGLVVAIAGSSQRMMHGLVLDSSAPLYGRAVEMIEVKPLRMADFTAATGVVDPVTCVKAYAAWGGIPRYWELAEPFAARVDEAVDRCVLDPLSPLHSEPDRLLLDEVPPALALRPILDAIGLGAHRPSEIAA